MTTPSPERFGTHVIAPPHLFVYVYKMFMLHNFHLLAKVAHHISNSEQMALINFHLYMHQASAKLYGIVILL